MNETTAKNAPVGPCKLCRETATLIDSHIVPRWMYRRLTRLNAGKGGPNLVHTGDGISILGGSQLSEYMLCRTCEDRFKRWEDYAVEVSLQEDDTFPGADLVKALPRDPNDGGASASDYVPADASALNCDALARFGVSVIWRASVCTDDWVRDVDLGPYAKPIADYLRDDDAPIPDRVGLMVEFARIEGPNRPDRSLAIPYSGRGRGYHIHRFLGLGMLFSLCVGGLMPLGKDLCLVRGKRVLLSTGKDLREMAEKRVAANRPVGAIARRLDAARRARGSG